MKAPEEEGVATEKTCPTCAMKISVEAKNVVTVVRLTFSFALK